MTRQLKNVRASWLLLASLVLSSVACRRDTPADDATPEAVTEAPVEAASAGSGDTNAAAGSADPPSAAPIVMPTASPQAAGDRDLAIRLGLVPPEPLPVAQYLTHADVRELVRYDGALALGILEGVAPSPEYNTIRLSTEGGYGFALQLWREPSSRVIDDRYARLRETYFIAADDPMPIGDLAFRAEFEGIRHYAFLDRPTRSVAVVTCQSDVCLDQHIRALAERVRSRL
jgi:hypothetical protein